MFFFIKCLSSGFLLGKRLADVDVSDVFRPQTSDSLLELNELWCCHFRNLNNYFNLFQILLTMRHKVGDLAFLSDSDYHLMRSDCLIGSRDTHDTPKHHSFSSWNRITTQPSLLDPLWFRLLAQTTHAIFKRRDPESLLQKPTVKYTRWASTIRYKLSY